MAYNKVVYNNNTLIDLTSDTVTSSSLESGIIAHSADGSTITGVGTRYCNTTTWPKKVYTCMQKVFQ